MRLDMIEMLGWSPHIVYGTLRYFLTDLPVHRTDDDGVVVFPDLPGASECGVQTPQVGTGPAYHRRYHACITGSAWRPEQVIERLLQNPNCAVPREAALFDRNGARTPLQAGDEFVVRMPGPWDGPVRVVHADAHSLRLVTLPGHLEAGQIEFRAHARDDDLIFEIESWARSGDWLADLLYDKLSILQELQTYLWAHYCARVCALAGGRLAQAVDVNTIRDAS